MSDHKTHGERDIEGEVRVRKADVDELLEDPRGPDIVRDDVRLGGAVVDIGPNAGNKAREIGSLIEENLARVTGRSRSGRKR